MAGRPQEFYNMTVTTINVERDILEKAKRMLNISEVCRNALAQAVNDPEIIKRYNEKKEMKLKFKGIPKKFIRKVENFIVDDPNAAQRWAKVANDRFNSNIGPQDIVNFISYG